MYVYVHTSMVLYIPRNSRSRWRPRVIGLCFLFSLETIETKSRPFQIKLNLRVVVTNIQLFGFGLIESKNCKFCNKAPETLLHLFCTCPVVVTYWKNVSACISSFLKDSFSFNNFNKVFGVPKTNSTEHNVYLLNCLLLCARFVIYRCKYANRIPTTLEFYQQVQKLKRRNTFYRKTVVKSIFSEKNGQCYSEFIKNRRV